MRLCSQPGLQRLDREDHPTADADMRDLGEVGPEVALTDPEGPRRLGDAKRQATLEGDRISRRH